MKTITLTMDLDLKARLEAIAKDASTDLPTVAQVLIVTGMVMGRNGHAAGLNARIEELTRELAGANALIGVCRKVMEVNDPLNARDIFGPQVPQSDPQAAEGQTA